MPNKAINLNSDNSLLICNYVCNRKLYRFMLQSFLSQKRPANKKDQQIMLTQNKIFIYDLNGALSRLVHYYFSDSYHITFCRKDEELKNFDLTEFQVAFVVLSNEYDLIHLYAIRNSVRNIFVSSSNVRYNQFFDRTDGMIVLDFFCTKYTLIDEIRTNLKLFEFSASYLPNARFDLN